MRILVIITRADTVGGAQVHVRDLCNALISNNHEVLVVTGPPGLYSTDLSKHHIPFQTCETFHKSIRPFQDWQSLRFFRKTIQRFRPDLISTHSSKAGILGRIAAKTTETPCVFTAHGWAFTEGVPQPTRKLYEIIERLVAPLANQIICVSDYDRHIALRIGMDPARLKTIHNGMPDIPLSLRAVPTSGHEVNIAMIARFDQQKDHDTLLKAFQGISGAHLTLVGDGPGLQNTQALARELGLSEKVNFLGFRKDIPHVLAKSHIFTLISHWEGFPLTIIEAMRAGLPAIVSDVGGAAEAVVEGITGFTVPRSDVQTLRNRLSRLITDSQLRTQMGKAARKKYEQSFTFDRMFFETYHTYKDVLFQSKYK